MLGIGAAVVAAGLIIAGPLTGGATWGVLALAIGKAAIVGTGMFVAGKMVGTYVASKALPPKLELPMFKISPEEIFKGELGLLDVNFFNPNEYDEVTTETGEAVEQKSSALILQPTISKWYYALRNLAIVALLSILLYIGIRIVISSAADERAKYKQRLVDWLVAMCLLFFMHYIMSFAVTVTEEITKAIVPLNSDYFIIFGETGDSTGEDGDSRNLKDYKFDNGENVFGDGELNDTLKANGIIISDPSNAESKVIQWHTNIMGKARVELQLEPQNITEDQQLMRKFGYTVIYLALVMYTMLFLFRYLKRLLMLAFLTIIAPLMAMTYPLDKMKDGSAQGFNTWLKEYVYNLLIQPVHLILYTVLIGSALELVVDNLIYALVALGFILQAEKLLRKLFGFEKASTVAGGSALGGALAMQGINQLGRLLGRNGKGAKGNKGGNAETDKSKQRLNRGHDKGKDTDELMNRMYGDGNNGSGSDTNGHDDARETGEDENSAPTETGQPIQDRTETEQPVPIGSLDNMPNNNEPLSERDRLRREYDAYEQLKDEATDPEDLKWLEEQKQEIRESDTRGIGTVIGDKIGDLYDGSKLQRGVQKTTQGVTNFGRKIGSGVSKGAAGVKNFTGNAVRKIPKPIRNTVRHASQVLGKTAKGVGAVGYQGLKYVAPKAARLAVTSTLTGAAALGGFTAALVSEDFGNVGKWTAASAGAGLLASRGVTSIPNTIKSAGSSIDNAIDSAISTYNVAANGADAEKARQQRNADVEFMKNKEIMKKYQNKLKLANAKEARKAMEEAKEYRKYGITDDDIILEAMKADGFGRGRASDDRIMLAQLATEVGGDKKKLEQVEKGLTRRNVPKEDISKYSTAIRSINNWS